MGGAAKSAVVGGEMFGRGSYSSIDSDTVSNANHLGDLIGNNIINICDL